MANLRDYMTDKERAEYDKVEKIFSEETLPEELARIMEIDEKTSPEEFTEKVNAYAVKKTLLSFNARQKFTESYRGRAPELLDELTEKLYHIGKEEHEARQNAQIERIITILHKTGEEAAKIREESKPGADTFFLYLITESGLEDYFDALEKLGAEAVEQSAEAIKRAQKWAEKQYPGEKAEISAKNAAKITKKPVKEFVAPLDKVNSRLWNRLESILGGQLAFEAITGKKGGEEVFVYVSVDYSEIEADESLKMTKTLTPFDKRVQECIAALWNAGNAVVTITQIYSLMSGNNTKVSAQMAEKIYNSVVKMSRTRLTLDNADESAQSFNYPVFKYDAAVLPCEFITIRNRGQTTESAIHLFREPPLVSFAKGRKQITTLSPALLASPLNKTDTNILLEDYFIERIAHFKSGKLSGKILYESLFRECNAKSGKQRSDAKNRALRLLEFYQRKGHITGYTEEADGIIIHAEQKQEEPGQPLLTGKQSKGRKKEG